MTDQRDKPGLEPDCSLGEARAPGRTASISRRALMTGASAALPTILTLNSNAAFGWAVTSGTIGVRAADAGAPPDADAICVIGNQAPGGKSGVYEVSQSDFYRVRGNLYYRTTAPVTDPLDPGFGLPDPGVDLNAELACESTLDEIYYSADGVSWAPTPKPPLGGAVVSLSAPGAMASFTDGNLVDPDNTWPL